VPIFDASSATFDATAKGVPFSLFYTMNLARAASWSDGGFLGHTWSLEIEEQFYLAWPVIVILLTRSRSGVARLGWLATFCALTSAVLRGVLGRVGIDGELLYNATFSHVDGIFAGCALGVLWFARPDLVRRFAHPAYAAIAVGTATIVIVHGQHMNAFGFAIIVLCTVVGLADLLARRTSVSSTFLSHPVPVAVGRRSYGLYLYHWPIFLFIGIDTRPALVALGFALTFATAWLSFALIERPFLRLKERWSAHPATDVADSSATRALEVT